MAPASLPFVILASERGLHTDSAEAADLESAKVAARQLVEDGNDEAVVYSGTTRCGGVMRRADGTLRQWSYYGSSRRI